ncbi:MAG: glycosyltransferase [Promethearchaeota archaeon]
MSAIFKPVSIIIPIKNRGHLLLELIKNLSKLNYEVYEIIFVDDCSTDNTQELLKNYSVKSIFLDKSVGSAEARNIGIKEAKYDIIALTDSDCFVSKNWLKDLVPYLKNYDIVGGKVIFNDLRETKLNPFNVDYERIITKESKINFLNTSNMLFKKDTWHSVGGFLNYRIEDLEFSWRSIKKGFKLIYVPKGLVLHCNYRNPIENIKKYFKYGKSYASISYIHGMNLSIKPEPIINIDLFWKSIPLFLYPVILLLSFLISRLFDLSLVLFSFLSTLILIVFIYHIYQFLKQIDIIYKFFKFSVTFSIVVHIIIFMLKKNEII